MRRVAWCILVCTVAGTFYGKSARIVHIAGHNVETSPSGRFLFVENDDRPGMVGEVGTILGRDKVNIADMSLSRLKPGSTAYMVVRVDSEPSEAARQEIKSHAAIQMAKFVQL